MPLQREVRNVDYFKCVCIIKKICKSNCITGITHVWYYLLSMSLPFHMFINSQTQLLLQRHSAHHLLCTMTVSSDSVSQIATV